MSAGLQTFVKKGVGTPVMLSCAGTNVTTGAYVQIQASTGAPASALVVGNTSASPIALATGGAGSERQFTVIPPGCLGMIIPQEIKNAQRISAISLSATASTGFITIGFLA
jgi:hypothetical protein